MQYTDFIVSGVPGFFVWFWVFLSNFDCLDD